MPKSSRSKNKDLEHTARGQKLINNPNYSNKRHDFSDFIRYSRLIRNSNSKEFYENSELYQKRQDKGHQMAEGLNRGILDLNSYSFVQTLKIENFSSF